MRFTPRRRAPTQQAVRTHAAGWTAPKGHNGARERERRIKQMARGMDCGQHNFPTTNQRKGV